jgi:ubiquinone/menaquinone biosynthesis C-methylase UbiE
MAEMNQNLANWQKEYCKGGIPSSVRNEPSKSLLDFFEFLTHKNQNITNSNIIDIGCGKGRNSIYAASQNLNVTSIDLVNDNIEYLKKYCTENYINNIQAYTMDVTHNWPFPDNNFDYAYDAFCFKHIIESSDRNSYKKELARTLEVGGYLAISLADIEDGYYSQYFVANNNLKNLIIDPGNNIASILYSYDDLVEEFSPIFTLESHKLKTSTSEMHGKIYNRKIHQFIFKNTKAV